MPKTERNLEVFCNKEVEYIKSQRIARIATVSTEHQPDVAPVGFEFDGHYFYIGGIQQEKTNKYKNVVRRASLKSNNCAYAFAAVTEVPRYVSASDRQTRLSTIHSIGVPSLGTRSRGVAVGGCIPSVSNITIVSFE